MNVNVQAIWTKFLELAITYGPKLILAIIILFAGFWIIKNCCA